MMATKSKVLSIFASCRSLQSKNGEDHSNAHAGSCPQIHSLSGFFPKPCIVTHVCLRQRTRKKREGIVLDPHSQMATASTEAAN